MELMWENAGMKKWWAFLFLSLPLSFVVAEMIVYADSNAVASAVLLLFLNKYACTF